MPRKSSSAQPRLPAVDTRAEVRSLPSPSNLTRTISRPRLHTPVLPTLSIPSFSPMVIDDDVEEIHEELNRSGQVEEIQEDIQSSDADDAEGVTCAVCSEAFTDQALPCQHTIHLRCIAMAGQNVCSLCRQPVVFPSELQALFEQRRDANERERLAREQSESLALARRLQREAHREAHHEERPNTVRVQIDHLVFTIELSEAQQGALDVGDMMLQTNQALHNINNRVMRFQCDERVLSLVQIVRKLNAISAESNLSLSQLCSIIENSGV